jgi:hypothetical protein
MASTEWHLRLTSHQGKNLIQRLIDNQRPPGHHDNR